MKHLLQLLANGALNRSRCYPCCCQAVSSLWYWGKNDNETVFQQALQDPFTPHEIVRGHCARASIHSHALAPLTPHCHPVGAPLLLGWFSCTWLLCIPKAKVFPAAAFMDTSSSEWDEVELEAGEAAVTVANPTRSERTGVTRMRCFPATLSGCFLPREKHSGGSFFFANGRSPNMVGVGEGEHQQVGLRCAQASPPKSSSR